jgi:twitching motility protein PilT
MSDERRKFRADALQGDRRRPRRREVLIVTSAVSNLIREAKTFQIPSIMQVGKSVGMVGLNDSLMDLVAKKLVAPEEVHSKSVDKMGFEALLKRAGIDTKFTTAAKEG